MASEGTRFTDAYAACTVCAPSRCALMTGFHTGHARIRGNRRNEELLRAEDFTIPEMFKKAGYTTGIIGKRGSGGLGYPGYPTKKGWDEWYGFFTQLHAHNYYPEHLLDGDHEELVRGTPISGPPTTNASCKCYSLTPPNVQIALCCPQAVRVLAKGRQA